MTVRLHFREPLSGLGSFTEYDLAPLEGAAGTYTLRASEQPQLRLFVADAAQFVPDYAPNLGESPKVGRILLVLTPTADGLTVNLLAPIVVDADGHSATQVIVSDDLRAVAVPLRKSA